MRWTPMLVLGAVGMLSVSGMVSAQIAAPVLTPGTADVVAGNPGFTLDPSFVPTNPAVMSWNGASTFGLGQTNLERDPAAAGKNQEFSATYGGFRWTGEKFAVGIEISDLNSDSDNQDFSLKTTTGGISGKVADWFSLGLAIGNAKVDNGAFEETVNGWTVGGTARIGDIFYAGFGMGRDKLEHKQTGNNYDDERSTSHYGLGLYTGGGKGGNAGGSAVWHLEYSVDDRDDFEDPLGTKKDGYTRTTGTVEVIWKNILVSYASISNQAKAGDGTLDGSAIEAGWVSDKSFFITARLQSDTEKDGSTKIADGNSMSVNIGLQF